MYNVRLGIDGTPEGNLNFTLEKPENLKVLGTTVVNNGDSIAILVLCEIKMYLMLMLNVVIMEALFLIRVGWTVSSVV